MGDLTGVSRIARSVARGGRNESLIVPLALVPIGFLTLAASYETMDPDKRAVTYSSVRRPDFNLGEGE